MDPNKVLPIIVENLCTACGDCVAACPTGALELAAGKVRLARPEDCAYCGDCESLCPRQAIALPFEIVFEEKRDATADRSH